MKIKYTGKEQEILDIMAELKGSVKAIRVHGNAIVIPTKNGAREFYKGETIVIENGEACLEGLR